MPASERNLYPLAASPSRAAARWCGMGIWGSERVPAGAKRGGGNCQHRPHPRHQPLPYHVERYHHRPPNTYCPFSPRPRPLVAENSNKHTKNNSTSHVFLSSTMSNQLKPSDASKRNRGSTTIVSTSHSPFCSSSSSSVSGCQREGDPCVRWLKCGKRVATIVV
jgi:hypothetical protein